MLITMNCLALLAGTMVLAKAESPIPSKSLFPKTKNGCYNYCVYNKRIYQNGESFRPSNDICKKCTCVKQSWALDHVMCWQAFDCTSDICEVSRVTGCFDQAGTRYAVGQTYQPLPGDHCTTCTCENPLVCKKKICPKLTCPQQFRVTDPNTCCPYCGCFDQDGKRYAVGQTYQLIPGDYCTTCTCEKSAPVCTKKICPQLTCPQEFRATDPNTCCPYCDGCKYEDRWYKIGEKFYPDKCKSCTCVKGDTRLDTRYWCMSSSCTIPDCGGRKPIHDDAQCCPYCPPADPNCPPYGITYIPPLPCKPCSSDSECAPNQKCCYITGCESKTCITWP